MTATVTVILPTYQRARLLPQALDSVLAQSHPPAQVIVVDDGSTDDTARVLAAYAGRVTVIQRANGGKPDALNAALPVVESDYIWVFDDDDIACPDALARHVAVLERRPEVGFTYSGCCRCHDGTDGALVIDGAFPVRPFDDDEFFLELLLSCYTAGPAVVVRSSIQRAAGPYQADLLRSEDFEMAIRWALLAPPARLDEARPTYFRRSHPGPRGAARERFTADEIDLRARAYERRIVTELGRRLELRHFLPYSLWQAPASAERQQRARFRRWVVWAQKGLWDLAAIELDVLAGGEMTAAVLADVRQYGGRALGDRRTLRELAAAPEALRELRALLDRPGLDVLRHCLLRQLYYSARAAFGARGWRDLAATLVVVAGLLGGLRRQPRARQTLPPS